MKRYFFKTIIVVFIASFLFMFSACDRNSTNEFKVSFNTLGGSAVETIIVAKGEKVVVTVIPTKAGYDFMGWFYDDAATKKVNFNAFNLTKDITLFAGWIDSHKVSHTITVAEYAHGSIFSSVASAMFGTQIEVNGYPNEGYKVEEGSLAANGVPIINNHFIMGAENVLITANFVKDAYTITSYANSFGELVFNKQAANMDETVTFYAIPKAGYYFKSATLGNEEIVDNKFIMPGQNVTVFPNFEKIDTNTKFAVLTSEVQNGKIVLDKSRYSAGELVSPKLIPNDGYVLHRVLFNDKEFTNGFIMPSKDVKITAEFVKANTSATYNVSITNSENGAITVPQNSFYHGEEVIITVTPQIGYELVSIKVNGEIRGATNFLMPNEDIEIVPMFVKVSEKISINSGIGGKIIVTPDAVRIGQVVKVQAVADEGYTYVSGSLSINGQPITNGYFVMVSGAVVSAEFLKKPTGSGTAGEIKISNNIVGGSIVASASSALPGARVELTITPQEGYRLKSGSLMCNSKEIPGNYFIMENGNVTISAEFEKLYTLTSYFSDQGYVITDVLTAAAGDTVYFATYPKYGYIFKKATYNGKEIINNKDYFIMPDADVEINAIFGEIALIDSHTIEVNMGIVGGALAVSHAVAAPNILITLTPTPQKGFRVKEFYYIVEYTTEKIIISDVFAMPAKNIMVGAIFEEIEADAFTLQDIYARDRAVFACELNINISYTSSPTAIHAFLAEYQIGYLSQYVTEILSYNDEYQITALRCDDKLVSSQIAQALLYFGENHQKHNVEVIDNIIYMSAKSAYNDCPYMVINGVEADGEFLYYKRQDDTYGIYKYMGLSNTLIVPKEFNGRIITKLNSFSLSYGRDILTNIVLSNIQVLDDKAFANCTKLVTIDVSRITNLGRTVFYNNRNLTAFYSYGNEKVFIYKDILYEKINMGVSLVAYPIGRSDKSVDIYSFCTQIEPYAFYGAKITEVIGLQHSQTSTIGEHAFENVINLSKIDLSTISHINEYAFGGVHNLGQATLTKLRFIGEGAFSVGAASLIIRLGGYHTTGSSLPITLENSARSRLTIFSENPSNIDAIRQNAVWQNYSYRIFYSDKYTASGNGIYFEGNGGSYTNCTFVGNGGQIKKPADPIKNGYTFEGWYTDENLTNKYNFSMQVTAPIRLYAKYI